MKKIILLLFLCTCVHIRAQTPEENEIEISFNVLLDGKSIETDSVQVGFVAGTKYMPTYAVISNSFKTFFKANREYYIVITHPGYNKQILRLKTDIIELKTGGYVYIYLTKGTDICNIGTLKYNKLLKRYILQDL